MGIHKVNSENELSKEKKNFLKEYDRVYNKVLSNDKIFRLIQKHYQNTPKATFDNTVCRLTPNLNTNVVLAFCKTFGVDIYSIYQDESDDDDSIYTDKTIANVNSNLSEGFWGSFYGYFFNNNPAYMSSGLIDQFVLKMTKDRIQLEIKHYSISKELDNITEPDVTVLNGTIIFNDFSPYGIVAITFGASESDCFFTLAYNKFPTDTLHFRKGVMITENHGTPGVHHPVVQSFIFTDKKIDLNDRINKQVLQGALYLPTDCLLVKKELLTGYKDSKLLQLYQEETGFIDFGNSEHSIVKLREDILRTIIIKNDINLYQTFFEIKSLSKNIRILEFPDTESSWHYISSLGEDAIKL